MTMIRDEQEIVTVTPADWVLGPPQGSWTYEAYAALPDDGQRYEVVQGEQTLLSRLVPLGTIPVEQFFARI